MQEIFEAALALSGPARDSYIDKECAGAAGLAEEVRALIRNSESAGSFLDNGLPNVADSFPALQLLQPGERLGPYQVLKEIGRGGMGAVYLAVRADNEYKRNVAIKVMRVESSAGDPTRRFRAERQILATLDHPHIAGLIDGGTTASGLPYLVMEFVEGEALDTYCAKNELTLVDRLALFTLICDAVSHAHRKLIIHRDLKPGNILVTKAGTPKLLDFGIAKLLDTEMTPFTLAVTGTGARLLTPEYASPEQVRNDPVTTVSDVYALGVVLYELVAGRKPYELASKSAADIERTVCETEPVAPSIAAANTSFKKGITGDLDTITMTALRKEPDRRYSSVDALAQDVRNHIRGRPITAHPDTLGYRMGKFVRRNVGAVIAGTIVITALAASSIAMTALYLRAESAREHEQVARMEAETQRETAETISQFLREMLTQASPRETQSADQIPIRDVLDQAADRIETDLAEHPALAAELYVTIGAVYRDLGLFTDAIENHAAAADLVRALPSPEPRQLAESQIELGLSYFRNGEYEPAEEAARASYAIVSAIDPTPLWSHRISRELSRILADVGKLDEAEALATETVALLRSRPDASPDDLAWALDALGTALFRLEKFEEAEIPLREALALSREVHGPASPGYAHMLNTHAIILTRTDQHKQAAAELEEALTILQSIYEEGHMERLTAESNLADALLHDTQYAKAEKYYQNVLATLARQYGADHPAVATIANNLGRCYEHQERYDDAIPQYERALGMYRSILGEEHAYVALVELNLARVLRGAGDRAGALQHAGTGLAIRRELYDEDSPQVAEAVALLDELQVD